MMPVLSRLATWLSFKLQYHVIEKRKPDFVVGGDESPPYLLRWFLIPRNRIFNIYLHEFHRSDADFALHDHPWANISWLLSNEYTEHTIAAGGVHHREIRKVGDVVFRRATAAHRIELHAGVCRSLFITGPKLRTWGFHCPKGWVPWRQFVDSSDSGRIGKGCDE
jgi:hypothetical protein